MKVLVAYEQNQSRSQIRVLFTELRESASPMDLIQEQAAGAERSGYRLVAPPKEVEINGRKAIEMVLTGKKPDIPDDPPGVVLGYGIADASKKKVFTLLLGAAQTEYDTAAKDFMEVVNTFQIR